MAYIKKLPNGTFQATISAGRDANGKQIRYYITRKTEKACRSAARQLEQEIEEKRFLDVGNVRLSTWMDKWLELNKSRLASSTYLSYKTYIDVHFKPALGKLKLNQINEIHLQQYMADKLKELSRNNKKKTLSSNYIRKQMMVLGEILQDALKQKNPAKEIKLPPKEEYVPHVITDFELAQIYNAFDNPKHKLIILLSALCGLRRGEIFALKWDDIDWTEGKGTIRIDESKTLAEVDEPTDNKKNRKKYVDGPTKNRRSRIIAVSDEVLNELKNYRKSLKKIDKHIITGRPDNFSNRFGEVMKKIGLPNIRFHDIRHYHATWLYNENISDHYAAERLGHDIHVLKGIYQHLRLDRKIETDNKIRKLTKLHLPG